MGRTGVRRWSAHSRRSLSDPGKGIVDYWLCSVLDLHPRRTCIKWAQGSNFQVLATSSCSPRDSFRSCGYFPNHIGYLRLAEPRYQEMDFIRRNTGHGRRFHPRLSFSFHALKANFVATNSPGHAIWRTAIAVHNAGRAAIRVYWTSFIGLQALPGPIGRSSPQPRRCFARIRAGRRRGLRRCGVLRTAE